MIRLLNIYTMQLHSFASASVPPYAAASHRWLDDETTYETFVQGLGSQQYGHKKIESFCSFLRREAPVLERLLGHALEWLWIDTCCIKKSDPSELSEAINQMFDWYASAQICLAYLFDVTKEEAVAGSSWFTRGWTLQELLAPSLVVFLDKEWQVRGHKKDIAFGDDSIYMSLATCIESMWLGPPLAMEISTCTGIPRNILDDFHQIESTTFGNILQWMNHRTTTRQEDQAYCLLGIIDIAMPLNYGENELAMIRLLEQVRDRCVKRLRYGWYNRKPSTSKEVIEDEMFQLDNAIVSWYQKREQRRKQDRRRVIPQESWEKLRHPWEDGQRTAWHGANAHSTSSPSNAKSFNTLLTEFNEMQQQSMKETLGSAKSLAFFNPLETKLCRETLELWYAARCIETSVL